MTELGHGVSQEAIYRWAHDAIRGPYDEAIVTHEAGGHLIYKRGKGVRKASADDCYLCTEDGLDDMNWHRLSSLPNVIRAPMWTTLKELYAATAR